MSLAKKLGIVAATSILAGGSLGYLSERLLESANEANARYHGIEEPKTPPLTLLVPLALGGVLTYRVGREHYESQSRK